MVQYKVMPQIMGCRPNVYINIMIEEGQELKAESKEQESVHYETFEHARWVNRFARKKKQPAHPSKRFNHASLIYKKYLYVFGGANTNHEKPIDGESMYRLSIDTFQWEILPNDSEAAPGPLSAFGYCLHNNCMLIFGGSNNRNEQNNDLWSYNFDDLKWLRIKQSGEIPEPRESVTCTIVLNDYMFMYGGLSLMGELSFSDMYLFDLNACSWRKLNCSGDHFQGRTLQSGCSIDDRVYIFGGQQICYETIYFDDFFEIKVKPSTNQAIVKNIKTVIKPPTRSAHGMLSFKNQYVIVIGGECNPSPEEDARDEDDEETCSRNDVWLFDITRQDWIKIEPKNPIFKHRAYQTCVEDDNKIYVFGGLKNNQMLYDDVMILELDIEKLQARDTQAKLCPMCLHKGDIQEIIQISRRQEMSFHYLQSASNMIKFPFAAIGLLIDNCIQTGATVVSISVVDKDDTGSMKNEQPEQAEVLPNSLKSPIETLRYILIEDNGRPWSNQELTRIILKFQMINQLEIQITDKKAKSSILRQNHKKEFGNNLKLGCLRLGKGFLYVSYSMNYVRVALFAPKKQSSNEYTYVCYYYIEDLSTGNFLTTFGAQSKRHIFSVCKHIIKPKALAQIHPSHQLYIFELRETQTKQGIYYELNPYRNDYIYGNLFKVEFLEKIGYNVLQCPDFSLRAYISLLYLKMETKIFLQTDKMVKEQIFNQMFLDKIDKQKSSGFVKEIDYANEYPELGECKVVELYYNPIMERKSSLFHAGILIYHKNRLICRFKYELGLLFPLKFYKRKYKRTQNIVFQFFGFIELPDGVPCNFLKTDVQHGILMENFNSSLKLIIKDIKRKISNHEVMMPKQGTVTNGTQPKKMPSRPIAAPFIIRTDQKQVKQPEQIKQLKQNQNNTSSIQSQPVSATAMDIEKQPEPKPPASSQNLENKDNMPIERPESEIEAEDDDDDQSDEDSQDEDGQGEGQGEELQGYPEGEGEKQQGQEDGHLIEEEVHEERANQSEPLATIDKKEQQMEEQGIEQQKDSQVRPQHQSAQVMRPQLEQDQQGHDVSTKSLKDIIAKKYGFQ